MSLSTGSALPNSSSLPSTSQSVVAPIRTRIAPSPTGVPHVGTAWMSMFDLAFARQTGGQFVVRIEDTDRGRFVEGAEQNIYDAFKWLGIAYDEGGQKGGPYAPYHQSQRLDFYKQYAQELIQKGYAYYCFATKEELDEMRQKQQAAGQLPKYDRRWRDADPKEVQRRLETGEAYVIRMKIPDDETVEWEDVIRGKVSFSSNDVDDQVLMKSDGFPTYHLAVVVDDHLMNITHVIRGEEWISSTPKHLLLYRYFAWQPPKFAHMPLIRNADHSKLSKRKNDVSILSYKEKGYLPEALVNFLALLGWSHPEGKEFFPLDEFLQKVSRDRIQKTAPVFDVKKLDWMNGVYIRELSVGDLGKRLEPFLPADFPREKIAEILPLVRERLVTLKDIEALTSFFYRDIFIENIGKALILKKSTPQEVQSQLQATFQLLEGLSQWTVESIEKETRALQEEKAWQKGQYFMLLRVALTGQTATPPLFETMAVLGRELVLKRLRNTIDLL